MEVGETKNNLTLKLILPREKGKKFKGVFECVCGNEKPIVLADVRREHTRSCGCLINPIGESNRLWSGFGEISGRRFNNIKYDSKARNYPFDLTIEYLWELYLSQKGLCIYSGVEINFNSDCKGSRKERYTCTASLDRIDSNLGYVVGNVQWIHKVVNFMKQALPENEFLEWVERIYVWKIRK